jgi:hypothetical protein
MEQLHTGVATAGLSAASAAVAAYLHSAATGQFDALSDADVLAELREFEVLRRRLTAVDHALIAEVDRRAIPDRLVMPSTSAMLQCLLRLSPHEAKQRVQAARACGPRHALTGQSLPPLLPQLAGAQATGQLSTEHARVILHTLAQLPGTVSAADHAQAEQHLVEAAHTLRPREVGLLGQRILAHLNPDGVLDSEVEQQRRRGFALHPNTDGSYTATGRLTPGCGALRQACLTPGAAPRPGDDTGPDPRSHSQRMHDALQDLAGLAVRRTELTASGAPAQVIITLTADQLGARHGLAETSFGQLLPVNDALRLADEASLHILLRDRHGVVLDHGRTKRIATRTQTLALIARDRGCSFPGCDQPPEHCQRHHIVAWPTAARPIWTTSPWSAATTTASSSAPAGAVV